MLEDWLKSIKKSRRPNNFKENDNDNQFRYRRKSHIISS